MFEGALSTLAAAPSSTILYPRHNRDRSAKRFNSSSDCVITESPNRGSFGAAALGAPISLPASRSRETPSARSATTSSVCKRWPGQSRSVGAARRSIDGDTKHNPAAIPPKIDSEQKRALPAVRSSLLIPESLFKTSSICHSGSHRRMQRQPRLLKNQ